MCVWGVMIIERHAQAVKKRGGGGSGGGGGMMHIMGCQRCEMGEGGIMIWPRPVFCVR